MGRNGTDNEEGRKWSVQRERKETIALTKITVHDDWITERGKGVVVRMHLITDNCK